MKRELVVRFYVGDKVKIQPLDGVSGRVISVWLDGFGVQYEVRYFYNGKGEKAYFYDDELEDKQA
jgi:hypothetical protein